MSIRRCLEKSPDQRFRSAHDLGYALEAAAAAPDSTPGIDTENKRPSRHVSAKWLAAVVVFCVVGALLYVWLAPSIERELRLRQLQQLTVMPLTALPGNVASPTFSPDGSQIAFAWDGENSGAAYDLYVKAIGTEKPLRLTHQPGRPTFGGMVARWPNYRHFPDCGRAAFRNLPGFTDRWTGAQTACNCPGVRLR